ncbi:MAG: acylphosphatase [Spirochaetales bacterium]|nr:acylphosphatase [Spirochaetales bacterium]
MDTADFEAFHAIIEGIVQGVGFRFSTYNQAKRLRSITGYVRNLPDGTVEVVAEGLNKEIEEFKQWLRKGPPGAQVNRFQVRGTAYTGVYKHFSVEF